MECTMCRQTCDHCAIDILGAHICSVCADRLTNLSVEDSDYVKMLQSIKIIWKSFFAEKGVTGDETVNGNGSI